MSERFWNNLLIVGLITICVLVSLHYGVKAGRAEMKRWQDTWYAANWQSPEVVESRVEIAFQKGQEFQIFVEEHSTPVPPKKAKPAKAISAHEALSPIFNMLDVETTKHLTKFYVTIPYVEGHWEIMATNRVNAILRLGSTSWTEGEWDSCSVCKESRPVEVVSRERWLKEHCHEKVGDDMYVEKPCQPIPEQELILNCAPNFDCSKGLPAAKP